MQGIELMRPIFGYPKYQFNPQAIIKAVNYLHHLGYEKSLQALQSYCEMIEEMEQEMENYFALQMEKERENQIGQEMESNFRPDTENEMEDEMEDEMGDEMKDEMEDEDENLKIIWRLQNEQNNAMMTARLLFVRRDGEVVLPPLRIGKPMMMKIPENPEIFPLFPLHIHRGIPLFLVMGYIVLGEPQPPSNYIEWCARECQLRAKPLIPDSHPLAAVEEFLKSAPCQGLYPDYGFNESLQSQVLCAVSNIYPVSKEYRDELLASNPGEDIWSLHQKAFAQLNAVWNPITNEYEIN